MVPMACDRKVEFGGRCRNTAEPTTGRCIEILSHKEGTAAVVDPPTTILAKFKLFGGALVAAMKLFRSVPRFENDCEKEHELAAKIAGRQFKGVRADGERGDSGTPVFRKEGLVNPDTFTLVEELATNGFALADVHCFSRDPGQGFLVLGYYKQNTDRKPLALNSDQRGFINYFWTRQWGRAHIWSNIPQHVGVIERSRFKFIILDERDGELLAHITRPLIEEAYWIPRVDFERIDEELVHTVNFTGKSGPEPSHNLVYREGLWGVE